MDTTPQDTRLAGVFRSTIIRTADPSSWSRYWDSDSPVLGAASVVTLFAVVLPLLLLWTLKRYKKMQDENRIPFPFMQLPQELRDMVYEHLVEDPIYPPPPPCRHHRSSLDWMIPGRRSPALKSSQPLHKSNWIFLASKQVYREYMDMLCQRATFHLAVSPHNYKTRSDTTRPSSSDQGIWSIGRDTLKSLRTCSLKLVTTSAMLGVTDPRNMTSSEWTLARYIREELKGIESVTTLMLDAKAIGDPLWNPLWIWYHASQSFKAMGVEQIDTLPLGPKLNRITFSLDTWSPGENYLERDDACDGRWTWYCMKGHAVGLDVGPEMTVREFCGKLYQECKICRPELDSEDDED